MRFEYVCTEISVDQDMCGCGCGCVCACLYMWAYVCMCCTYVRLYVCFARCLKFEWFLLFLVNFRQNYSIPYRNTIWTIRIEFQVILNIWFSIAVAVVVAFFLPQKWSAYAILVIFSASFIWFLFEYLTKTKTKMKWKSNLKPGKPDLWVLSN